MNKTTFALALGTGLALMLGTPTAHGAAVTTGGTTATDSPIQVLSTAAMPASTFNSVFTPYNTAMVSPFTFQGASDTSGMVSSQVFQGTGTASGLYAYVYQVATNNTTDGSGEPVHVDGASFKFGSTPVGSDLTNTGQTQFGYNVQNGQLGGLGTSGTQTPAGLSWQAGTSTGFIRSSFVDPTSQVGPLGPGTASSDVVLLSTQAPTTSSFPSVNIAGASATSSVPLVYTPTGGTIDPIPIPEPSTFLAWMGMAGAVALVRRIRKTRQAIA